MVEQKPKRRTIFNGIHMPNLQTECNVKKHYYRKNKTCKLHEYMKNTVLLEQLK